MAKHYSGKRVAGRKPVGKRALSLLMALVMSLSLVQITAFAVDTTGTTQKDAEVAFVGGSSNDGTVEVSKTVKKAAGTNDFEITLTVTVPKDQTIETGEGANVVLVMDRSNSMAGKGFENAKKAATAFVNKLMEKGGNKVAVVGFGNNYEVSSELTGDKSAALKAVDAATKSFPKNWYETSSSMGGTNIQAGIYAARNILADHEGEQNFIIVFSDGKPTFSYKSTIIGQWEGCYVSRRGYHYWNDGMFGDGKVASLNYTNFKYTKSFDQNGLAGDGQNYSYDAWATVTCKHGERETASVWANNGVPAIMEAGLAKDAGAVIYSVYVGKDQEATDTMKKVASDGKYYSSEDMDELTKLFGGIVEEVIATTAKSVVDPMGAQIVLGDVSNLPGVTKTADGLTWNPTAEGVKCTVNEDGSKTYEVTYPITLNTDETTGFVAGKEYDTNGKTTFTYSVDNKEYTIDFPIPRVKGYLPETEPPVVTETSYTVKHQYFINNKRVDKGEVTTTSKGNVGDTVELVATDLLFEYGEKTYADYEADPGMSIELVEDASKNVIVVSYYLTEETEPETGSYSIYYQYYTNDVEVEALASWGSETKEVGTTVNATDVPLKPVDGYELTSITTDGQESFTAFEVKAGGATSNSIVYVRYDRETTPEKEPSGYSVHHSYYTNGEFDGESYEWVSEGLYVGDVIENATDVKTDYPTTFKDNEYKLTEIDGLPLTLSETITENVIEVRYDRTVEVEPEVRYTVLHEYYVKGADTAEARLVESFVAEPNQEVTLNSITPVTQPSKLNDYTYEYVGGSPETLTVTADGENTFVLRYERTVEINPDPIPTTYTVKHEYYTNGVRDDKGEVVDEKIAGEVGDEIGVTSCNWKQTYGGNSYGIPAATPISIILVADAKENVITLRYDRTTSTPVNPPVNPPVTTYDYYTVTVNYLDKDSGAVIHEKYSTTQREHTTYDVTAQDKIAIEGYTYVETTGDALTGTLNGNKVINVYYSKTTDIDDGDTPTTPAEPGSDIGDDDVPTTPAQPPKTGDSMGLWIAAAMVSGMGLVWLALSGKKREERA